MKKFVVEFSFPDDKENWKVKFETLEKAQSFFDELKTTGMYCKYEIYNAFLYHLIDYYKR